MASLFSQQFRQNLKRELYRRSRFVILRGQIVLNMQRLPELTSRDYIRVSTLELVADEIQTNNVGGCVCELGVYQGDFAKHISVAFPDRKLYLFDTFEGFNTQDKHIDINGNFSKANEDFSNTTVDLVLSKIKNPGNAVVRAGYFPDSIHDSDKDEAFAFVSIDADLYKPIYEGLQFFYPRLSKGGYIFVHDYNNTDYPGAKAAVQQYCREQDISHVPLVDPCGTTILSKG